jgi:glutamate-1-semialdehyde aminotransferase
MFQVFFTKKERVVNYRDFMKCNQGPFTNLRGSLIKNMAMADESNSEPLYTCAAHDTNDLEQTLNAFETSMKAYIKSRKGKMKT